MQVVVALCRSMSLFAPRKDPIPAIHIKTGLTPPLERFFRGAKNDLQRLPLTWCYFE